ncbi:guanine-specific ribonuclease N1 and T1 [Streptomyces sp. NBC_00820]|uniref:ribonuclease domain-containing protein n=1 Tax=Streptomyces sp. NBC_00820 TaxID=2975842 RepID=UPI002ED15D18|nr:guanine-specific ribonuclease N1 and T1 [Streptomyces sp. NBC_00820]
MLLRFVPHAYPRRGPGAPVRCLPRVLAGVFLALAVLLTGCSGKSASTGPPTASGASSAAASPTVSRTFSPAASTPAWARGMATVPASRLPAEARQTLALIDKGGPFPYARDGVVFGNFERLLPGQARGYYHEYTVTTPGSRDRGARRIVTGQRGEIYYTDDHYSSFRAVLR